VAKVITAQHAIRIPQRQLVLYTDRVKNLLASSAMTALAYTRQLGFAHLVYPGAQGNRFEHSLGVFDLACHFILRMSGKPAFRRVCSSSKDTLLFVLAALLHDVGHFPYAHQLEEFEENDFEAKQRPAVKGLVAKDGGHYEYGKHLIEEGELNGILKSSFQLDQNDIIRLRRIFMGGDETTPADPALLFLRNVLGGPVDLDKLDYIERDANHCGVPYGSFVDSERIFETMRICETDGTVTLAFDERGVGSLEQLAVARHQLYANVYWHRAVRAGTAMFKHLFYLYQQLFPNGDQLKQLFYSAGSDDRLLKMIENKLEQEANRNDQSVRAALHLASVVSGGKRALYRAVVQRPFEEGAERNYGGTFYINQRNVAKRIYDALAKANVWELSAAELGDNNILIDCRSDKWPKFGEIKVLKTGGSKPEMLANRSPLITQLGETFKRQACKIRVFINIDVVKPEYRSSAGRITLGKLIRSEVKDTEAE
jgi:HD superfamily phosphohydrolase